jgi:hypothetical protein
VKHSESRLICSRSDRYRQHRYDVNLDGTIVEKKDEEKKGRTFLGGKKKASNKANDIVISQVALLSGLCVKGGVCDLALEQPVFNEQKTMVEKNNMLKDNVVLALVSPRSLGDLGHLPPLPPQSSSAHSDGPVVVSSTPEEVLARQAAQKSKLQSMLGSSVDINLLVSPRLNAAAIAATKPPTPDFKSPQGAPRPSQGVYGTVATQVTSVCVHAQLLHRRQQRRKQTRGRAPQCS